MTIYLAGITANMVLFILALLAVAFFPVKTPEYLLTVMQVNPGSPAEQAGIQPGFQIIQMNYKTFPTHPQLREAADKSADSGEPIYLTLLQNTGEQQRIAVIPDAATGLIGITLTLTPSEYSGRTSGNILDRIKNLSLSYVRTTARMIREERRT